ncbi:MAG TPA: glycosyltransferase [Pyrinomonadaceae bacterium]|nr:glycosyltransferase [Pyrinomonadaceae bacterium]
MIHLVIREPIGYQRTLCHALNYYYRGDFIAWFASGCESEFRTGDGFNRHFLAEIGFRKLFGALRTDREAVVILGGWSSPLAYKTLLITTLLRVPTLIWADHPRPRQRTSAFEALRRTYLRLLSRRAICFLACGTPTVEHLAALGISRNKIFNFPYWVDVPTEWSPPSRVSDEDSAAGPLRLLAVGRLAPEKGFDNAIEALALANANASRAVAELLIIGDGPECERLEHLVNSLDVRSSVAFTGRLENATVFEHLRNSDALVVPSEFEPYGVVVLEALAHGRPVLASDKVIAAIDRDDSSGAIRFHSVGDADQLAEQIKQLAHDPVALRNASQAARAIAEAWKPHRAAEILQGILNDRLQRGTDSLDHDPQNIYQQKPQPTSDAS